MNREISVHVRRELWIAARHRGAQTGICVKYVIDAILADALGVARVAPRKPGRQRGTVLTPEQRQRISDGHARRRRGVA